MKSQTDYMHWKLLMSFLILILLHSCKTAEINIEDYNTEILTSWNEKVINYAKEEDGLLTLKGVRTAALMHAAIHNALNSIEPFYSTYEYPDEKVKADPIAATTQAAFEVAVNQFPEKKEALEKERDKWLAQIADGTLKTDGIELGKQTATAAIEVSGR